MQKVIKTQSSIRAIKARELRKRENTVTEKKKTTNECTVFKFSKINFNSWNVNIYSYVHGDVKSHN